MKNSVDFVTSVVVYGVHRVGVVRCVWLLAGKMVVVTKSPHLLDWTYYTLVISSTFAVDGKGEDVTVAGLRVCMRLRDNNYIIKHAILVTSADVSSMYRKQ